MSEHESSNAALDDDTRGSADGGHWGWVFCPTCGERVLTCERPYYGTKCQCGITWRIVIKGEGAKA